MVAQNIAHTKDQSKTFYLVSLHLSVKGITAGSLRTLHAQKNAMYEVQAREVSNSEPPPPPSNRNYCIRFCTADSHAWDKCITDTQPMWYSPQRTLTHGASTSHSPCGTVRSELSHMGQVHYRHTQPMWYSPQRTLTHGTSTSQTHTAMWWNLQWTLTHGTSTSQTHTALVVQSAVDSHAWDKYITDTHSPCDTVRSGLSRIGQVHHRHTAYVEICIQH